VFMREVREMFRLLHADVDTLQTAEPAPSIILPIDESDVTDLVTDLAGKAPLSHSHAITDLTGGSNGNTIVIVGGVKTWTSPSIGWDAIFSGGQDGSLNFNGGAVTGATLAGSTYTLTQNIAATDLAVAGGYIVETAGYIIFANGTLSGTGTISNNGQAGASIVGGGTAGTGGAGAIGGKLPGGATGGNGAINAISGASGGSGSSNAPTWNPVASGGAGGATTGTAGTAGSVGGTCKGGGAGGRGGGGFSTGAQSGTAGGSVGSVNSDSALVHCLTRGRAIGGGLFGASTGGGGAASPDTYNDVPGGIFNTDGAGGGGAGGWVVVCARHCTFTGTIEAKGGAGGNGYSFVCGGGSGGIGGPGAGGGGGGTIICIIGDGSFPTFNAAGGAGGTGGTCTGGSVTNLTGPNGGAGGTGKIISMNLSV
jgi:hypothetical protein